MDIEINLDLSRFSEDELRSFFKDGIISGSELISELNRRIDLKFESEAIIKDIKNRMGVK